MSSASASLVLHCITGIGAIIWLLGLRQHLLCLRERSAQSLSPGQLGSDTPAELVEGSLELEGEASALCSRAAAALANQSSTLGPFHITDKQPDRVCFDGVETLRRRGHAQIRRGELRFEALGAGRTRVDYWAETRGTRGLLLASAVLLFVGLVVLCCGYFAVRTFVVTHPSSAVRGQAFQMLHVAHLLWPTFLCSSLYRRARRAVSQGLAALVANLPYIEAPDR